MAGHGKTRRKATGRTTGPRRAIGYVRVSSVGGRNGPGYHTLDLQRESIERVCNLRGYELIDTYIEQDWSGADENRPQFREVMERVLAGEADAVAVWKVSRFSRSWEQAAREVERLLEHGSDLLSGEEGFDTADVTGRLLMRLLFSLADWEREVLAAQFETIKERVIDRGSHLGRVPIGYLKVRDKPRGDGDVSIEEAHVLLKRHESARDPVHGALVPDPTAAPVVRRAFELRADGASLAAIQAMMDEQLPRPEGGLWTATQVARMLSLRTYLGEVRQDGEKFSRSNLEAHEPIVPITLFNEVAASAPARVQRGPAGAFPLSGRVFCAGCSYSMGGGRPTHRVKVWRETGEPVGRGRRTDRANDEIEVRDEPIRVYRCPGRRGTGRCPSPSTITAAAVEEVVRRRAEALEGLIGEVSFESVADPQVERLTARIETLSERISRLALADDGLDPDQWEDTIRALTGERQNLLRERSQLTARAHRGSIEIATWRQLTEDEQLEVLRDSIHAVFIRRLSRSASADDRVHIIWTGDADAPPVGGRANRIAPTPFVFPDRN